MQELKLGFVDWLRDNKPTALLCKVEQLLRDEGHVMLWTRPYCPDLQSIELYWAAGKNNVARKFENGRSMKAMIADLRDGWYGNAYRFQNRTMIGPIDIDRLMEPVDYKGLVRHAVDMANKIFVPLCKELGISGAIGDLKVVSIDEARKGTKNFPIDLVVLNVANEVINVDDDVDDVEEDELTGLI